MEKKVGMRQDSYHGPLDSKTTALSITPQGK
jgi:hypothetical protein